MFKPGTGDNLYMIGVKGKVKALLQNSHLPESMSIVQAESFAKEYVDPLLAADGYKFAVHIFSLTPLSYCLALYTDEEKLPTEWWNTSTI